MQSSLEQRPSLRLRSSQIKPNPKLRWQGQELATRVWVRKFDGRFLFHTNSREAYELLLRGSVEVFEPGQDKIAQLLLLRTPGPVFRPVRPKTAHDYKTPPMVWHEGLTYDFKRAPIIDGHRWAYQLAVTSNRKLV